MFREVSLSAIRECIAGIQEPTQVVYRLRRVVEPVFELEDADEAPDCLAQRLSFLPVPREVIYQAKAEVETTKHGSKQHFCYASRIDIEADEMIGVKTPTARVSLKLEFPLAIVPRNDAETIRLLSSWALTPFFDPKKETISGKIMPDAICRDCIGEKFLLKPGDEPEQLWPPRDEPKPDQGSTGKTK